VNHCALADGIIERNYIAEPDASDYAFQQVNSDRDKVTAWLATRRWQHVASSRL
jgi:hypothetical protein